MHPLNETRYEFPLGIRAAPSGGRSTIDVNDYAATSILLGKKHEIDEDGQSTSIGQGRSSRPLSENEANEARLSFMDGIWA